MNEETCDFCCKTKTEARAESKQIILPPEGDKGICSDCLTKLSKDLPNLEDGFVYKIEIKQ